MAGTDGERRERVRGAVLGLAVGDAVGTTVEFQAPGSFAPVVDLVGGGVFELPAGAFTDDTSMALCLAESLVELGAFDLLDQLERYVRWWRGGHLSSTGTCFDIGATTRMALAGFAETGAPSPETSPTRAGNGSLMRLAPAALAGATLEDAIALAGRSSLSTHAAPQAIDACRLFGAMLWAAADGAPREAVLDPAFWRFGALHPEVEAVARGSYHDAEPPRISGAGYVVGSLEAALWALARGDGYADAVLRAVNLGDDADTTGAICGQLAGALAGEAGIPTAWRERLVLRSTIEALADGVAALALAAPWAVPWPETYWAVPGAVLAGEHPARGGPASAPGAPRRAPRPRRRRGDRPHGAGRAARLRRRAARARPCAGARRRGRAAADRRHGRAVGRDHARDPRRDRGGRGGRHDGLRALPRRARAHRHGDRLPPRRARRGRSAGRARRPPRRPRLGGAPVAGDARAGGARAGLAARVTASAVGARRDDPDAVVDGA